MKHDFIVVGSGLAGLTSALVLKNYGQVLLITKKELSDSASFLAQGGIAAVVDKNDSFSSHIKDTLIAGAFHNNKKAVEVMVKKSPYAVDWLVKQGVVFDRKNGEFLPTLEGGHSQRRILHAADFTGKAIELALIKKAKKEKNIEIWENTVAINLIIRKHECFGIQIIRGKKVFNCFTRALIIATGGIGQLYQWTTNPYVATADGLAMGLKAGLPGNDLEFVQFHPTALKNGSSPLFLLSEALRGEGGHLVKGKRQKAKGKNYQGEERFMKDYDTRMELAPRDIVARAIFSEQKKGNEIYLDFTHKKESFIKNRFPNIDRELKNRGFKLVKDLIPVTPAAHYSCGGIKTDLYGRTKIKNLFVYGETAWTGVQGANRLASNSLLEAVVFPLRLPDIYGELKKSIDAFDYDVPDYKETIRTGDLRKKIKKLMWQAVGIVRKHKEMRYAYSRLSEWVHELDKKKDINEDFSEVKNMALVGKMIVSSALNRKNSLGGHFVEM